MINHQAHNTDEDSTAFTPLSIKSKEFYCPQTITIIIDNSMDTVLHSTIKSESLLSKPKPSQFKRQHGE
jgi:hypothetical protein